MSGQAIQEIPGFSSVSDANVCNWYFIMFVFISLVIVGKLLAVLMKAGFANAPVYAKVVSLVVAVATTGVVIANAGFQFTMCKRALSV